MMIATQLICPTCGKWMVWDDGLSKHACPYRHLGNHGLPRTPDEPVVSFDVSLKREPDTARELEDMMDELGFMKSHLKLKEEKKKLLEAMEAIEKTAYMGGMRSSNKAQCLYDIRQISRKAIDECGEETDK